MQTLNITCAFFITCFNCLTSSFDNPAKLESFSKSHFFLRSAICDLGAQKDSTKT